MSLLVDLDLPMSVDVEGHNSNIVMLISTLEATKSAMDGTRGYLGFLFDTNITGSIYTYHSSVLHAMATGSPSKHQ